MFQKIKERNDAEKAKLPNDPIKITLPDGTVKEGVKHKTTPFEIAMGARCPHPHCFVRDTRAMLEG